MTGRPPASRFPARGRRTSTCISTRKPASWRSSNTARRTRQSGEDVAEERIILEYQDVNGLKSAKKVLINRDGKKFTEAEVLDVKFLDKLDDAEFVKP